MFRKMLKDLGLNEEEFHEIFSRALEKKIPLKFTQATPSEFFHWKKNGILQIGFQETEKHSKIKLNLIEAVWVRFLIKLRNFDVSVKSLKEIHQILFSDSFNNIKEDAIKEIEGRINATDDENEIEVFQSAIENLNSGIKDKGYAILISDFGIYMMNVIVKQTNTEILISFDEKEKQLSILPNFNNEIKNPFVDDVKKGTYISVNLLSLISEILGDEVYEKVLIEYNFFNENEADILNHLKRNDVKEIVLTKVNDEEFKITIVEHKDILGEDVKLFKRNLGLNNYKKVNVTLRNEKHLVVENTMQLKGKF